MKSITKMVLMGVSLLMSAALVALAAYQFTMMADAEKTVIDARQEYVVEYASATIGDWNGQSITGTEVINLIRKFFDSYSITITEMNGTVDTILQKESALNWVQSAALYRCELQAIDSVTGNYSVTQDVGIASRINFTKISSGGTSTPLDYSGLINIINPNGVNAGGTLNQEMINALCDYVNALKEQNTQLAQQPVFKQDTGTVNVGGSVTMAFVPTDLILWNETVPSQNDYVSLSGVSFPVNGIVTTKLDDVTVKLVMDANGVITSCTIENGSTTPVYFKSFRASN